MVEQVINSYRINQAELQAYLSKLFAIDLAYSGDVISVRVNNDFHRDIFFIY